MFCYLMILKFMNSYLTMQKQQVTEGPVILHHSVSSFMNSSGLGSTNNFFNAVFVSERKRTGNEDEATPKAKEEQWNLKDVIFVEDVRNVPVGKVLKVSLSVFCFP